MDRKPHTARVRYAVPLVRPGALAARDPWDPGSRSDWTDITSDIDLVWHLLALYFCRGYPIFASLSKEHFLNDFILP